MRLPRDVSGRDLVHRLARLGYEVTRQTGSHVRLTRQGFHLTIPDHASLRIGTLSAIVSDVAAQLGVDKAEAIRVIFDQD